MKVDMGLRALELRDAPLMLEWMHDCTLADKLQTDFSSKNLNDCINFIKGTKTQTNDIHLAIVDKYDEYMGTVSLKNVKEDQAEFAIAIRRKATGKGYSIFAMREMIRMGFEKMHLSFIYWCVNPENIRALKFYDKNGFLRITPNEVIVGPEYSKEQISSYIWYGIYKSEYQHKV